jgi:hypothetical protein
MLSAILAASAIGMAAAGQKVEVETHVDKDANFSTIKTYAWLPPAPAIRNVAPGVPTNPTLSQDALGPHIVAAVDRQLARRGMTRADEKTADVLVVYFAALNVGFSTSYLGEHYGYLTGWGSPVASQLAPLTSMEVYEKGTVLVDIVQREPKRAIWRGTAVTRIHQDRSLEQRIGRIDDATERMFQRFPIKPKG